MKIKLIGFYSGHEMGSIIEVENSEGKRLIDVGGAVAVATENKPDVKPATKQGK